MITLRVRVRAHPGSTCCRPQHRTPGLPKLNRALADQYVGYLVANCSQLIANRLSANRRLVDGNSAT